MGRTEAPERRSAPDRDGWLAVTRAEARTAADTANHLNGASPGGKGDGDRIGRIMAEIVDTEQQISAAKEEAERIRLEVRETVTQIDNPVSQKVIMMYYLEHRILHEIAQEICYSQTQAFRVLETGLAEIERILPDE